MQASTRFQLRTALAPLALALVLAAPCTFAKKDLFANDPGSKQNNHVEQLVPNAASSSSASSQEPIPQQETVVTESANLEKSNQEKTKPAAPEVKSAAPVETEKKSSYFETQLTRLKGHLVEAKEDLFGSKKSAKKETPNVPPATESIATDSTHVSEEAQPELPTISTTEAAQRAQALAEGQVINVRKYQDEGQPRYAVKLLQKNGRMKTINLDAVTGTLIEETPQ